MRKRLGNEMALHLLSGRRRWRCLTEMCWDVWLAIFSVFCLYPIMLYGVTRHCVVWGHTSSLPYSYALFFVLKPKWGSLEQTRCENLEPGRKHSPGGSNHTSEDSKIEFTARVDDFYLSIDSSIYLYLNGYLVCCGTLDEG